MSHPKIMLGGVPIVLHAGAPAQSIERLGGEAVVRLSDGKAVKMTHWGKASGSISGDGWMPPGLDGLDYSQPLELRLTQPDCITGTATTVTLTSTPRPDVAPWALALVGDQWQATPCSVGEGVATLTAVTGAELYALYWMPVYSVFVGKPGKSLSATHGWTINWEEA